MQKSIPHNIEHPDYYGILNSLSGALLLTLEEKVGIEKGHHDPPWRKLKLKKVALMALTKGDRLGRIFLAGPDVSISLNPSECNRRGWGLRSQAQHQRARTRWSAIIPQRSTGTRTGVDGDFRSAPDRGRCGRCPKQPRACEDYELERPRPGARNEE